ncbi:MAG: hypothetical protein ACRBCK_00930 [Alphaproteobacteria bacterium]
MAKRPLDLSEIINVASDHFEMPAEELCSPQMSDQKHSHARLVAIFVAAEAGYSNAEIAGAMNYKSANTVSTKFNSAINSFRRPQTEDDVVFRRDTRAVAKASRVDLAL